MSPGVKTHSASSAVLQRRFVTTDALPEKIQLQVLQSGKNPI
jgi:hypothetical protein